jgi:hypothetical protein
MNWTVVARDPRSPHAIRIAGSIEGARPVPLSAQSLSVASEGVVVAGSDADLAAAAFLAIEAGRDTPLALAPNGKSDLLRMFAVDPADAIDRLDTGERYRCDLGLCTVGGVLTPFLAHVVAGPGRLGRTVGPSAPISVSTPDRVHDTTGWAVIVANAQHLGADVVAPRAALMDGVLDLQVVGGSPMRRHRIRRLRTRGFHIRQREVWRRSASAADIAIPSRWRVKIDGVIGGAGPFSVRVAPSAFDLWL